ncbi:MAG: c-type cytochrome [Gaiellaceae bacterium]
MTGRAVIGLLLLLATASAACALLVAGSAGATGKKGTPGGKLAAKGYHLYGQHCLRCHGPNAEGSAIAPSLRGVGARGADFYLRTGYMPLRRVGLQPRRGRQVLDEHEVRALVAYVASFRGPPIARPQPQRGSLSEGQALFAEHCAGCHQIMAQGGYVTNAVAEPLRVPGMDATTIAEAVRTGPYVMPTFTYRDLSSRQLDSIVRYVLWAQHPAHPGGWGIDFLGPVPEGLVTWFIALPLLIGLCVVLGRRLRS